MEHGSGRSLYSADLLYSSQGFRIAPAARPWRRGQFRPGIRRASLFLDPLTLKRYNLNMRTLTKRAIVYFDPQLHKALRVKAAETECTVSELVNNSVRQSLAEDAEDLAAFEKRRGEPNLAFEAVGKDLKRRGKL